VHEVSVPDLVPVERDRVRGKVLREDEHRLLAVERPAAMAEDLAFGVVHRKCEPPAVKSGGGVTSLEEPERSLGDPEWGQKRMRRIKSRRIRLWVIP
jgi:hypothetical protein